tara:strand:- start:35835 stop:37088 length:1254 start_codon:yes stop_codon:yes gene_type:complete
MTMKNVIQALLAEPMVKEIAEQYKLSAERFLTSSLTILSSRLSRDMKESEVLAMCSLMKRYHLDPFAGHLYLRETFEGQSSTILPVLKIDGWLTMLNGQEQFDGLEFAYSDEMIPNPLDNAEDPSAGRKVPVWMEASIFRKDRTRPTVVREYFLEVYQNSESWRAMGCRQLRHKTIIQCSRVAFGLGGLFDEDDISRMLGEQHAEQGDGTTVQSAPNPEKRASATTFVAADVVEGDNSSSTAEDDDELLAASFGDTTEVDSADGSSPEDEAGSPADSAGATSGQEALPEERSEESVVEQPVVEHAQGSDSSGDEAMTGNDDEAGADAGAESEGSQKTSDQLAAELSKQELAMANKIVSEFNLRIRGAGDKAKQQQAVTVSLNWLDESTKIRRLPESVAQYIKVSVLESFPEMLPQAA